MTDNTDGVYEYVRKGKTVDKWPMVILTKYNFPGILNRKHVGKVIQNDYIIFIIILYILLLKVLK